jgi:hypothetical protein
MEVNYLVPLEYGWVPVLYRQKYSFKINIKYDMTLNFAYGVPECSPIIEGLE